MQPDVGQQKISISSRDCPVCGQAVDWSRYWLRGWLWAKWPCARCGSLLGFDSKNRLLVGVLSMVLMGAFVFVGLRVAYWIALPAFVAGSAALGLLDRVKVVGNRNNRFCASCRYDLTGTLAAGITRCPECGHASTPEAPKNVADGQDERLKR